MWRILVSYGPKPVCIGQVVGFGWHSLRLGLDALVHWLEARDE